MRTLATLVLALGIGLTASTSGSLADANAAVIDEPITLATAKTKAAIFASGRPYCRITNCFLDQRKYCKENSRGWCTICEFRPDPSCPLGAGKKPPR